MWRFCQGSGPGCINLHLSAHLSRSLKNPLRVHLRVLHGTHLALSQVSVLRGNLRAHLRAHVTLL